MLPEYNEIAVLLFRPCILLIAGLSIAMSPTSLLCDAVPAALQAKCVIHVELTYTHDSCEHAAWVRKPSRMLVGPSLCKC